MPRFDPVQTNFTAGELSPRLKGNFQLDKYKQGLQTLENMLVQPHGGVSRRGGFKYVAEVKTSSKATVLHSFNYKDEFSYILEFGDQYIRFYRNQAQIMDNGSAYEVATTYLETELRDLRIAQDEDTLYIVHKNHLPAKLTRADHDDWTLVNIDFSHGGVATVDTIVEPTIDKWTLRGSIEDNNWYAVCWSPELGLFAAISGDGTNRVMTSSDGVVWADHAAAEANNWTSICWSPELGLFVAVASTGTNQVMTSPNGITWTYRSPSAVLAWRSVCWSPELNLFCAVATDGAGNTIMTSPDGIIWTGRTPEDNNQWYGVCWSPELTLFCAVSNSGTGDRVMTSPDGLIWTTQSSAADEAWYSVCWSPELTLFVAVASYAASSDIVMTSPNGIAWTVRTASDDNSWVSVCWSPELGLFVAVSIDGTGDGVMTSSNGTAWTAGVPGADQEWRAVCWSPALNIFVAVASTGTNTRVMTGYYGLINGTYTEVILSGGSGSGVEATIVVAVNAIDSITIVEPGEDYEVNDTLDIAYTDVGGAKGPITCDVATLDPGLPTEWGAANYPTLCWFFEQRFWLASTPNEVNQVWGSKTAEYFNFYTGTGLANEAIDILIKEATKLLWITTSEVILLGTNNGAFRLSANNLNEAITPTNIRAPKMVSYGSAFLPAVDIDGNPLFIQRGLRKVRRLEYDLKRDRYKAIDITILSEHITESGLIDIAYADEPSSFMWGVRTDGQLVCLTYEPEYEVFGWDRHIIGGTNPVAKSIAVSDAVTADEDELWAVISRTIDGSTVQYVEFLTQGLSPEDIQEDAFFVDSGVTKVAPYDTWTVVAHDTTQFITIYLTSDWSKVADPGTPPAGNAQGVNFSPNGLLCAVGHEGTPFVTIYNTSDWSKVTNPSELPTGLARGVIFSPDGSLLVVPHAVSPYLTIYNTSDWSKVDTPDTPPANQSWDAAFNSDGSLLVIAHSGTPFLTIYNTSDWSKVDNPGTLPSFDCYAVAFSPDDSLLVVAHYNSPFITIYNTSDWSKVTNPGTLPDGHAHGVAFSPNGSLLAVGHEVSPYTTIYNTSDWSKVSDPATPPGGNAAHLRFNYDGSLLIVPHEGTPFLTIYNTSDWSKVTNPSTLPDGHGNSIDFAGQVNFTTFDGLDHLEGETVAVFADGLIQATKVVSSGEIVVTAAKAHAGLPYISTLETLPIEGGNPIGSAMGKIKRISKVVLRLYKSLTFTIGDILGNTSEDVVLDTSLYTDDSDELAFYGGHETGGQMKITINDPVPFTLLAIMYKIRTGD